MRRAVAVAVSTVLIPSAFALSACSSAASPSPAAGKSAASGASATTAAAPTTQAATNAGLTSAEVNAAINTAANAATALHIEGSMDSGGQAVSMNLQLNQHSASGSITESGLTIPIIAVGSDAYIEFTSSLIAQFAQSSSPAVDKLLLNKWVSSTSQLGSSLASSLSVFMSLSGFVGQMASTPSQLTADGTATVDGQLVANYIEKDTTSSPVTTELMSIAASGPALPVKEVGLGTGNSGSISFTWNQPTTVTAPPASEIYSGPGA